MKIYFDTFKKKYIRPKSGQFPVGTIVFKGFQGSGKTLSMVHYVFELQKQFPKCIVFSNVIIRGLKNFHFLENDDAVAEAISATNGSHGVVLLLDEAHLFFNKKNGISLDVLTAISQQRKDRRRIILSSQIWEELDVSLRKQVKHIVNCTCRFGKFQFNSYSDGETLSYDKMSSQYVAKHLFTEVFKHNQELYNSYDTYQKIIRNNDYSRSSNSTIIHNQALTCNKTLKRLK